jgi:hypothetical protein
MKTFTAKQLRHNTAEVFEVIREDGNVIIEHKHYKGKIFLLTEICQINTYLEFNVLKVDGLPSEIIAVGTNESGMIAIKRPIFEELNAVKSCNMPLTEKQAQRLHNYRASEMAEKAALGVKCFNPEKPKQPD